MPRAAARRLRALAGRQPAGVHLRRLRHRRSTTTTSRPVKLPGYRVDALTDAAIRFVDAHQDEPFFLFLSFLEPHHQNHLDDYPAPDGYRERYRGRWTPARPGRARRLGAPAPGRLLRHGQAAGRGARAAARRAEEPGARRATRSCSSPPTTAATSRPATTSTSAPATTARSGCRRRFQGPGFDGGGQVRAAGQPDRSAADAARRRRPAGPARDAGALDPAARCGASAHGWPEEVFIQISESQVGRAIRTQRWKYGVDAPDKDGWRDPGSDRYVEEFLYDLVADPYELTNLIGLQSHAEVADCLARAADPAHGRGRRGGADDRAGRAAPHARPAARPPGRSARLTPAAPALEGTFAPHAERRRAHPCLDRARMGPRAEGGMWGGRGAGRMCWVCGWTTSP